MKYIDIHTHLDFKDFDSDREEIIADMKAKAVSAINIGTSLETSMNSLSLAEKHEHIHAIVGVHPVYVSESKEGDVAGLEALLTHPKCVGIGECGLDFFRTADDMENKKRQRRFFEQQIELAIAHDKTLMIHCREAYPETLEVLKSYKNTHPNLRANFHFFTESIDTARIILDLDFTVSFTGVVTFVPEYADLVNFVPLNRLMSETDSPYVAPKKVRGSRNDPRNVIEIVERIAEIKDLSVEETTQGIAENVERTFGIALF